MHSLAICLLFFRLLFSTIAIETQQPCKSTECYLLNCGSSSNLKSSDNRYWEGDNHSSFSDQPKILEAGSSSASNASEKDPFVPQVPFMTVRIFLSKFTYSFPVTSGQKFIRLYFYPATYSGHAKSQFFFSITANGFTLTKNFSAYLTASAMNSPNPTLEKEFIVNMPKNERLLNITFNPSPSSYAFINGIEVVSMPENLYLGPIDKPIVFVNNMETSIQLDMGTALETVYRVSVGGGQMISGVNDTAGMFRTWLQDLLYIFSSSTIPYLPNVKIQYTNKTPAYTAPEEVYTTSRTMNPDPHVSLKQNLTWRFPVEVGFLYLVRLHFCETQLEVTESNQRVFFIFLNEMIAEEEMDVIFLSGGSKIPLYRDYLVSVQDQTHGRLANLTHGRLANLTLQLHPNMKNKPKYANAILNGVEIFKLNKSDGSLAGPNPEAPVVNTNPKPWLPEKKNNKGSWPIKAVITAGAVVTTFLLALSVIWFLVKLRRKQTVPLTISTVTSLPSDICRRFSLAEIRAATNNFDHQRIIGLGGFGNVYKGYIDDQTTKVAIKRLKSMSKQGAQEFRTEIEMLSKLRHVNLVSLIGYCDDESEMILVYEYMARGTLRDHLYQTENPSLPWKQRLQICIGSARGLHYLHTGAKHMIIHRDVKSTNLLLDEKWTAKVSDFGLCRTGPTDSLNSHVSTGVKGSFGYLDPEYCRRQQLTEKSDVYSFGVVLLEVLCSRPALGRSLPKEQVGLANWALTCYQNGAVDQIVDPKLMEQIAPVCLKKFVGIAVSCVDNEGIKRPSMEDVVGGLEFALQLQETAEKCINAEDDQVQASPYEERVSELFGDSSKSKSDQGWSIGTSTDTSNVDGGSSMSAGNLMSGSESVFSVVETQEGR